MPGLAFHTSGDDRRIVWLDSHRQPLPDNIQRQFPLTRDQVFQHYASRHGTAITGQRVADLMMPLTQVTPASVTHFYFFGHGAGDRGDFVVRGRGTDDGGFAAVNPEALLSGIPSPSASGYFLQRLAQLASPTRVTVEGHYCWSARGQLMPRLRAALSARGVAHISIRATDGFYMIGDAYLTVSGGRRSVAYRTQGRLERSM